MRFSHYTLALTLSLLTASSAFAQGSSVAPNTSTATSGPETAPTITTAPSSGFISAGDAALAADREVDDLVYDALKKSPALKGSKISSYTSRGVVTISGKGSAEQIAEATTIAQAVPGVKSVKNRAEAR